MVHEWTAAREAEFERQFNEADHKRRRGRSVDAVAVRYDTSAARIVIDFSNGCTFSFPPEVAEGLHGAKPAELSDVRILVGDETVRWGRLDVDLSVHGLLRFVFGSRQWMRELGRLGGHATSEAKAAAARRNGLKGGRPASGQPGRGGGTFELKQTAGGQFVFNLKAANGQVILTSEEYARRPSAERAIEAVRRSASNDAAFERKTSGSGQPFFVLKAANGRVIARSDLYSSETSLERGIASVKINTRDADVLDQTA